MLFVCTGNLCRSPMAEFLLRRELDRIGEDGWVVESAGIGAEEGAQIHEFAARVLRDEGIDPEQFRSRPVDAALLRSAGIVLTATSRQRAEVVRLAPAVLNRTFTIKEFAALVTSAVDRTADEPDQPADPILTGMPQPEATTKHALEPTKDPRSEEDQSVARRQLSTLITRAHQARSAQHRDKDMDLRDPNRGPLGGFQRLAADLSRAFAAILRGF